MRSAIALALVLLAAACGSTTTTTTTSSTRPRTAAPATLNPTDRLHVAQARVAIARYCLDRAKATAPIPSSEIQAHLAGIETLIRIYRAHPTALYETTRGRLTMRQVIVDQASSLDRCDADGARQLDRVLTSG